MDDTLTLDILKLILSNFNGNCNSFILRQVCKQWKSIVKQQNPYQFHWQFIDYNANNLSILKWRYKFHPICFMESNLLISAAKLGSLETLQWAVGIGLELYEDVFDAAAENGNLNNLVWLRDKCPWKSSIWSSAAYGGKVDAFLWLQKENRFGSFARQTCVESAIKSRNFDMFKLVYEKDSVYVQQYLKTAINEKQWNVVDFLLKDGASLLAANSLSICGSGNFTLLLQAYECGISLSSHCLSQAIYSGNWEMVKWLRSKHVQYFYECSIAAAKTNNFELLKYIHSDGATLSSGVFAEAVRNNNMEMLYWCLDHSQTVDIDLINACAEVGNVDLMEFLWRRYRNMSTHSLFQNAAAGGHLKMLQWARNHCISWDKSLGYGAIRSGRIDVLEWLNKNGFFKKGFAYNVIELAAQSGNMLITKWLVNHGATLRYFPYSVIHNGHLNVLKFLHSKNVINIDESIIKSAEERCNYPHVIRWMKSQVNKS